MEEVRDFQLTGDLIGVFHRFEPNISFWNIEASRTILCINIQNQLRSLTGEDICETDDTESALFDDDEDYVTASVSVQSSDSENALLVYGTRSGCVFGLSTLSRAKVFSIPFALEATDLAGPHSLKKNVRGLLFLPGGKLAVCYEGYGLALLDFNVQDPPDRPSTQWGRK